MNNYYKILDVKTGILQTNEKNLLTSKNFINGLIQAEKEILEKEKNRYWTNLIKKTCHYDFTNKSPSGGEEDENVMYNSFVKCSSLLVKEVNSDKLNQEENIVSNTTPNVKNGVLVNIPDTPLQVSEFFNDKDMFQSEQANDGKLFFVYF